MQRTAPITLIFLSLFVQAIFAQNYSVDFSDGDRNYYYGQCWRFSGTSIRSSGSGLINDETLRTGPVSNINDPHWVSTPVVQLMGKGEITFDHYISHASNRWLNVYLVEVVAASPDTINILSFTYTNTSLISEEIPVTQNGFYKILFEWSGTGGSGRGWMDNLNVPGPNVASLVGDCSEVNEDLTFPVEWLYFNVEQKLQGLELNWATATEQNSERFEVERSFDGLTFEKRGELTAAGYSSIEQSYSYTDQIPAGWEGDRIFYRLRQVDLDGRFDYSETREIQPETNILAFSLAPNPANTSTTLQINTPDRTAYTLRVLDAAGRLHLQQRILPEANLTTLPLSVQGWPKGVYLVQLLGEQHATAQRLVIR